MKYKIRNCSDQYTSLNSCVLMLDREGTRSIASCVRKWPRIQRQRAVPGAGNCTLCAQDAFYLHERSVSLRCHLIQ